MCKEHREVDIQPLTVDELMSDHSGKDIAELAELIDEAFRGPPWRENYSAPRLHFGLGVELMRQNALLFVARLKSTGKIVGFLLGKELVQFPVDRRGQTLLEISGSSALDHLFEGNKRVFYVDGIGVSARFRRRHIAECLSLALIDELRRQEFDFQLGRTDISAAEMRNLFMKLGFRESPVKDTAYPERTYWHLTLQDRS